MTRVCYNVFSLTLCVEFRSSHVLICHKNLDSPRMCWKAALKILLQIYPCPDPLLWGLPTHRQSTFMTSLSGPMLSSCHITSCHFLNFLQWLWVWDTSRTCWFFYVPEIFEISQEQGWELEKVSLQPGGNAFLQDARPRLNPEISSVEMSKAKPPSHLYIMNSQDIQPKGTFQIMFPKLLNQQVRNREVSAYQKTV